jgi:microcystin-dependent protein
LRGHLSLAIGKRLFLAEGSVEHPSLCFSNDGKPDTGLYHSGDGLFGVTCNNRSVLRFTPKLATFDTPVTAPTPTASDRSTRLATTEWVLTAISSASIGQIVFEARKTARAGFLKPNGALLKRNDYPNLWSYAQASGALVSEAEWKKDRWGCFSTGDGKTTFRLPELRGEFIRCWADTRTGIDGTRALGSFQTDPNLTHAHPASCAEVDDHVHAAWTDNQGNHGHHGVTGGAGHHQHIAPYSEINVAPFGAHAQGQLGSHGGLDHDNPGAYTSAAGAHQHEFWTEAGGLHGHNVGIGAGGRHRHGVSVAANGGNEARPRNVALLALIRAY